MESKLKPCPLCGGKAVVYHQSSKYTNYDGNYVHCSECGACGYGSMCDWCSDNSYGRPCVRALNEYLRNDEVVAMLKGGEG